MNYPVTNLVLYDLEVYPNFFLAGFQTPAGEVFQYTQDHLTELRQFLQWVKANGCTLCGYNSNGYDDLVLDEFLNTGSMKAAYVRSLQIIEHGLKAWDLPNWPAIRSIDLMPIIPGWHSLKKMGVSLGARKLQELPVNPKLELTYEQMVEIAKYNENDLEVTGLLLDRLQPELDLRAKLSERYQIDLRSKGEAQIAERVLLKRADLTGSQLKTLARQRVTMNPLVHIKPPSWWGEVNLMKSENMCTVFNIGQEIFKTPIQLHDYRYPKGTLERTVFLGDRYYQMGVGGLHSVDGPGAWEPGPGETMYDFDVASYYPSIILQEELQPVQWQGRFLPVYADIVQERLVAKTRGDKTTADVLKIVANGSFGKFGDQYSALFDPTMMAHVTVYGQLGLLLLIAALVDAGHYVASANTDGVTVLVNDKARADRIIKAWEQKTGMSMEETPYQGFYQQNVNNYVAVKTEEAGIKTKGALMPERDVRHSPNADVCARAVCDSLSGGPDIVDTVISELDINKFILATQVKGAWRVSYGGETLGKMCRWYKSTEELPKIMRTPLDATAKGNEGQLPDSEGGRPVPDLPEGFPVDLDYGWYINRAMQMYGEITQPKVRGLNQRARDLYKLGLHPVIVDPSLTRLTRHRRVEGEVDFASLPPGHCLGLSTGKGTGWIAKVSADDVVMHRVDKDYPGRTRKKILKDHGFELHYSANVPLSDQGILSIEEGIVDFDEFYTPAELAKVRG